MIRLDSSAETAEGNPYAPRARLGLLPEIASTAETHDADGNRLSTWRDANEAPPRG